MSLFGSRKARPTRPTDILERPDYGWVWKPLLGLVVVYLVVTLALGAWWSLTPDGFDVQQASAEQRGRLASDAPGAAPLDTSPAGRGAVIIATQMTLLDTLLDKQGGYLRNDMLPPGLWLDNMPAWELGVLKQARGEAHTLVEKSAMQPGALKEAQERLDGDSQDWLYPSTEHRIAKARDAYAVVLDDLNQQRDALPAEGDVPAYWLSRVARRLDELTYRLSASVADPEALRELEVDVDQLPGRTPWYRVDDIFFEARGQAWALEHLLAAMVADYGDVMAAADAESLVERLQAELKQAQRTLWSPVVLNGTGFGIFANHSLMMAAYTQRAAKLAEALSGRLAGVSAPDASLNQPADPSAQESMAGQTATQAGAETGAQAEAQAEAQTQAQDEASASAADEASSPGAETKAPGTTPETAAADESPAAPSSGSDEASAGEPSADSAEPAVDGADTNADS
ncbi:hypothetical protein BCL93_10172 [Onishia taeanensis]|uniref:DUF2333 family protein n=1 Tax=Onishia taeanensis TaxID=284577 RepID=A0A328Y0B3_9GAMM|nr:DUF2333 family protein [Halomonas taeanensis]RAR64254.1 hypothetical protein BCL93_10172 [Halomonas taeanensis]